MFRLSNILEGYKPKEFFMSSDKQLYTLKCQNWRGKEFPRKEARERWSSTAAGAESPRAVRAAAGAAVAALNAWEGHYFYPVFQKIIDENVPCLIISTCKNEWCSEVNVIIQFMTGDLDDIFLIHPMDLKIWDPDDLS